MSHYKELNKELVEQLQGMKISLREQREEIIYLRKELFQKHEDKVLLKKEYLNLFIQNCKNLILTLEPDADLLIALNDRESVSSNESRPPRKSTKLSEELQRSSAVIQSRQSITSKSPVRRSSEGSAAQEAVSTPNPYVIYEEDEVGEEDELSEVDLSEEITELQNGQFESVTEVDVSEEETEFQIGQLESIPQIDVSEKETEPPNCQSKHVTEVRDESTKEEELTDLISIRTTLNDITNTNTLQNSNNKSCNKSKTTKKSSKNKSNCNRTSRRRNNVSTERNQQEIEETIQAGRCVSSFIYNEDVSMALNSFTVTDAMASSTPNSRRNSERKDENTTPPTTNRRPSRSCKPKSLAEPKLGQKLRNESTTPSYGIQKKKSHRSSTSH